VSPWDTHKIAQLRRRGIGRNEISFSNPHEDDKNRAGSKPCHASDAASFVARGLASFYQCNPSVKTPG